MLRPVSGKFDMSGLRQEATHSKQDMDDHNEVQAPQHHLTAQRTWAQLMAHSELINDLESLSTTHAVRPVKQCLKYSKEYLAVLEDFKQQASTDDLSGNSVSLTSTVKALGVLRKLEQMRQKKAEHLSGAHKVGVERARRRWAQLRSYVREMGAKSRMGKSALNWSILHHMVKGMTNLEQARQDLYKRYGVVPIVMKDGKAIKRNIMLSNTAQSGRNLHSAKVSHRPLSSTKQYQPLLSSKSQTDLKKCNSTVRKVHQKDVKNSHSKSS